MNNPLQELSANEILLAEFVPVYKTDLDILWYQIVEMNCSIFILEKIEAFPFQLFGGYSTPFWKLTKNAFIERILMMICRISVDKDPRALTIQRLKNKILESLNEEFSLHRDQLEAVFNQIDEATPELVRKAKKIRNKFLAHLDNKLQSELSPEELASIAMQLAGVKKLQTRINDLFALLCFGHTKVLIYRDYDPNVTQGGKPATENTDIERQLDEVARNSWLLNLPETSSRAWEHRRKSLSEENLQIINEYRRKFEMGEA